MKKILAFALALAMILTCSFALADRLDDIKAVSYTHLDVYKRQGFETGSETYLLLGQLVQESGAQMITLHARTRSQFYEGHADWRAVAKLKRRVSIPVVGNGDVTCWQDALRMICLLYTSRCV